MLKYFYIGALHGLILGLLGCAIVATGMQKSPRTEAGLSRPSKTAIDVTTHRRAQKVFPVVATTGE
jgi:hypothetical protein